MSEYFLARMKRTRENGEAIGLNEPRPVPARQNRSRDWSNNQGIITLGGTAWIHYRSSSNDNCYITRRFGLWERQKSRGSIPEYKWHFQEHASDRVRIRRLTGSICNILSRNGSEWGEKGDREKHSAMRKCLHFSFLYLSYSSFFGKGKKSLREMAPPFGPI